jgi:hypothetical protein
MLWRRLPQLLLARPASGQATSPVGLRGTMFGRRRRWRGRHRSSSGSFIELRDDNHVRLWTDCLPGQRSRHAGGGPTALRTHSRFSSSGLAGPGSSSCMDRTVQPIRTRVSFGRQRDAVQTQVNLLQILSGDQPMLLHNGHWRKKSNILFDFSQLSFYCLRGNTGRRISHIQNTRGL